MSIDFDKLDQEIEEFIKFYVPSEYNVVCDRTNNSDESIRQGYLNITYFKQPEIREVKCIISKPETLSNSSLKIHKFLQNESL